MKSRVILGVVFSLCLLWGNRAAAQTNLPPIAVGESAETCLLITEILYDSTRPDEDHEWIELTNICDQPLDISNFKVGDEETREQREGMVYFPDGTLIEGQRSFVIAQSAAAFQLRWGFLPNFELRPTDGNVPVLASVAFVNGVIQLANGGDELLVLDAEDGLVDVVSYEGGAAGRGESLARVPGNCVEGRFQPQREPDPGAVIVSAECPTNMIEPITAESPPIGQLQGRGDVSPFVNQSVTFEGVVTGFHEDQNAAGTIFYTLFVQDLVGREDGDPLTSDGLPVFLGRNVPQVQIGDHVRVSGEVVEFYGFTEISHDALRIDVLGNDNPLPSPIEIEPTTTDFEALEGMRVRLDFAPARVVGATFDGCGLTVVRQDSGVERIYRRHINDPIDAAIPVLFRSDVDCTALPNVKTGDEISGLHGVLVYNFDQYKIVLQETSELIIDSEPLPEPPQLPAPSENQISLVSFNVENLFDGVDDTGADSEPKLSPEALQTKISKISYTLVRLLHCPTVVGLQEIEKALLSQRIADDISAECGFEYEVVHLESADGRGIDLAFLVDAERVEVISAELSQTCTPIDTGITDDSITCPSNMHPLFSRQPLVLNAKIDGQLFTLINNHFKSKRGGEVETAPRREAQAAYLRDLASQQLSANAEAALIVLGDFNDYEDSSPLQILGDGGLFNVLKRVPDEARYSFVFSGISQLIDGVFVSPALEAKVAFVSILHTNADYPDSLGSNLSAEAIAFKSTDHDLPYLILDMAVEEPQLSSEPTRLLQPTATPQPTPIEPASDSRGLMIGGGLLVGLAGLGGYWIGRKQNSR